MASSTPPVSPTAASPMAAGPSASLPAEANAVLPESAHTQAFHSALTSLQVEFHRHATEKLKWYTEKSRLQDSIATLESKLKAQESLNEMMAKRVRMLEFAIQHERSMRTAGKDSSANSVLAPTSLLPPVPTAPPTTSAPLRASQIIIRDYLLSLGYEPDALVDVYTSGNLDAIAAARKAGVAHLRVNSPKRVEPRTATLNKLQQADSAIGLAPSPESKRQRPWTLHRRGASALRPSSEAQASDAAPSASIVATNGAQASDSARIDPPAELASMIQQSAGDIASSRFSSKLTSSVTRRGANNAIPLTWIPGIPARSHMDVIRHVEWIPQNELTATGATSMLHIPTILTCSDDGSAKVWASTLHGRHATSGYAFANPITSNAQLPAALSAHLSVHKEAETEPLRTLRGHSGAVLSGCTISWAPSPKEVRLGDVAICSAERLLTAFLASRGVKAETATKLLECSSKGSLLLTSGTDGMVCVWAKPNDCISLPAERDPAWPPSILPLAYDLPAEACIPLCKVRISPGPVWCIGRIPPGYSVGDIATTELHEHLLRMDSMQGPVFYTIGDDQVLRFWMLGCSSAQGVVALALSELDLKPWLGDARAASAAVDPTSTKLALFVATTQGTILKVSASERLLLFTSRAPVEQGVAAFETASGKCVGTFVSHSSSTTSISVDPTGIMLATSGNDGDVRVWSIETKECIWRQRAHSTRFDEASLCVAFCPSRGAVLASVGADAVLKVFSGRVTVPAPANAESNGADASTSVSRESFTSAPAPSTAPVTALADNPEPTPTVPSQAEAATASLSVRMGSEPTGFIKDAATGEVAEVDTMGPGMAAFAGRYARGGRSKARGASSIAKLRAGGRDQSDT